MSTKREIANGYRRVANWFERNPSKWLKYAFNDAGGKCCGLGCWFKVNPGLLRAHRAEQDMWGGRHMAWFNDDCQSVEEVIGGFRKVARYLDHGGPV